MNWNVLAVSSFLLRRSASPKTKSGIFLLVFYDLVTEPEISVFLNMIAGLIAFVLHFLRLHDQRIFLLRDFLKMMLLSALFNGNVDVSKNTKCEMPLLLLVIHKSGLSWLRIETVGGLL
jgi:hypothetical protein